MSGLIQVRIPQSTQEAPGADHRAAKGYYSQGTHLLGQKRLPEAEFCLRREQIRLNPEDADFLNNLGTAVWEQGRAAEAMAIYLRAHQFKPNDFGILRQPGNRFLWEQGRPEHAVKFYRRALEIEPASFDTQMNLGVALSDLGQFDEACSSGRARAPWPSGPTPPTPGTTSA